MITYLVYYPIFWLGYLLFKITKKTLWYPYVSFRRLFVITKGKLNDNMSVSLGKQNPAKKSDGAEGILGKLSKEEIESIVSNISKDGFYIFETKVPEQKVDQLTSIALSSMAQLIPPAQDGSNKSVYDRNKILSTKYQFPEQELLYNRLVQEISFDKSLFEVAQTYLGCKPIQDLTAMWWSTAFSKQASSEAAQLYHFDMDRFKFIKFFFYLTDVDTTNGPHCYIRGSHKQMPDKVWKDGRIPDNEVQESFPKEDIMEITGKKGSIIAVDTRGLHKGKVLEKGERLILQIEYTNSLFGAGYQRIDLKGQIDKDLLNTLQNNKHSYQRFSI